MAVSVPAIRTRPVGARRRRASSGLAWFIARRLLLMIPMLFGIVTLTFFITHVLPGNPAASIAGPTATKAEIVNIEHQYGLGGSLISQYGKFLSNLVHLNLGTSTVTSDPVMSDLLHRVGSTLELVFCSLFVALAVGIPLGAYAGRARSRTGRGAVRVFSFVLLATPEFWLALLALYFLWFKWKLFPSPTGQLGLGGIAPHTITGAVAFDSLIEGNWSDFGTAMGHLALPVLVYGLVLSAPITRLMRSSMLTVMESDFVRFGKACGVPRMVMWRAAVRSALPSVVTYTGILFTLLLGGAVLIETIFSWGGMAQYAATAIQRNDYDAIQGFVLFCGVLSVLGFLAVDLIQMAIDPRIRIQRGVASTPDAAALVAETAAVGMPIVAQPAPGATTDAGAIIAGKPARAPRGSILRETWDVIAELVSEIDLAAVPAKLRAAANPALVCGVVIIGGLLIASFVIPAISSYGVNKPNPLATLQGPSGAHLFGTDNSGFDIFTRVFYAPRIDLWLAAAGVGVGAIIGIVLGLLTGVTRSAWISEPILRIVDVLQAFPVLILAIALVSLAGNGLSNVIWALAFINAPMFLRLVRTQVLNIREQRYYDAAVALGGTRSRVVLRHVLPNAMGPVVVQVGISLGYAILTVAGLAFLGVGVQAPTAEWGSMILSGDGNITTGQWWTFVFPGLLMLIAVVGFNLISEGIERARDIHR